MEIGIRVSTVIILLVIPAFVVCSISFAVAQSNAATLNGTVTDASGAAIPKAVVALENTATGTVRTGLTNHSGQFVMPSLDPGTYALRVQRDGFAISEVKDIILHTSDNVAIIVRLKIGSLRESITTSVNSLTKDTSAVSMTVSQEFVENMPLNGRSFQDLIQLAPGVVSDRQGNYSVDGQRTDTNIYTVDGVSANVGGFRNASTAGGAGMSGDTPSETTLGTTQSMASVESLQEFTIQTSGYLADYGRTPGAQIQFTTRSGTNSTHGALFEYLRNTVLDANTVQNDYYGYPKTGEHQNDFGGTISGSLIIPKLYDGKDKTFYFFSYEGLRLLLPAFESEYVPSLAFRAWAAPGIRPFLNAVPLPNQKTTAGAGGCSVPDVATGQLTVCAGMFTHGYSFPNSVDNDSIRIDHSFTSQLHAFARYSDTPSTQVTGAETTESIGINTHTWTAGLTATLTPSVVDDFRFNFSRDGQEQIENLRSIGGSVPFERGLLIPTQYESYYASAIALLIIPGTSVASLSEYGGENTAQRQYQLVDSLIWTRGKHSVKVGADWRRLAPTYQQMPYTDMIQATSSSSFQYGCADLNQVSTNSATAAVFDQLSIYAQDHWSINPRLGIDYGLRWEFNPAPGAENGIYPAVLTSGELATATLAPIGTPPYKNQYDKFAPRIGFVWNAVSSSDHPITLRGGFGIFYDTNSTIAGNAFMGGFPLELTKEQSNVPLPMTQASMALPDPSAAMKPPFPMLSNISTQNLTLPYTEQWNLALDASPNSRNKLTLSYVGNNGRKLIFTQEYGSAPFGNQNFPHGLYYTNNGSQSNYNALQIQDVGRIMWGLDLVGSFTWAHALDNASNDSSADFPERGNSDNDLRRVLNLALNYQSPTDEGRGFLRALMGRWLFANRFSAQSGYPIDIVQTQVALPGGETSEYHPDLVRGVPIYLHGRAAYIEGQPAPGGWRLNPSAFACVPTLGSIVPCEGNIPVRQGILGRNFVRTNDFWTLNTALQRSFPIHDQLRVNLRAEAFNILNHPNLGSPDATLPSPTFGEVVAGGTTTIGSSNSEFYAMGASRSLQLSLRLQF